MKRILLLGGYGFLGTNILKHIDNVRGGEYEVIVFDKFERHPADIDFSCVTRSYAGDFSDTALINGIFSENDIDIVIHAISTTVPNGPFSARFDIESNLIPTVSLLDIMIRHGVTDIVYISSGGAVYGDMSDRPHKESDNVYPKSSYGVVKLAIEKYLIQYAELYGLKPLILRLSNPYGPWHYSMKQGVCNVALASALNGTEFSVWGNGDGRKDYIYVEDFVRILFTLTEKGISSNVINVGSGITLSVNEILDSIKGLVPDFKWTYKDAAKFDVSDFALDTERLKSFIGDFSFMGFEEGLRNTLEWEKTKC